MHCMSCGVAVAPRANFCQQCGARAPAPVATAQPDVSGYGRVSGRLASTSTLPREDLTAALHSRQELGERLEGEVVDSFLARVERSIDARLDGRIDERLRGRGVIKQKFEGGAMPVALASLIFGIPITAISAGISGIAGLVVAWGGIAAVNFAHSLRSKKG